MIPMLLDQLLNTIDFSSTKTAAALQYYRIKPELRDVRVALNMAVRRLIGNRRRRRSGTDLF